MPATTLDPVTALVVIDPQQAVLPPATAGEPFPALPAQRPQGQ
jgi:hypothetical protein